MPEMRIAPPGRFVSGLHVRTLGSGRPFVMFESGIAATSANWIRVQQELSGRFLYLIGRVFRTGGLPIMNQ